MTVRSAERRELVFPLTVNVVLGCLLVAVAAIRATGRSAAWTVAAYAALVTALIVVILIGRRRASTAGRQRPGRGQRRLMRQQALRDLGHLPESADESWRPALRRAVVGDPFLPTFVYWIFFLAAVMIVPALPEIIDESSSDQVRDIAILMALVVAGAAISAGFIGFLSRAQCFNAQKMLDQLDARAADPVDA